MAEYIERQAAIDALDRIFDNVPMELTTEILRLRRELRGLSPADVVPVVRCKECIHHHYESKDIPYCDRIDYGYGWKDNDFCSRGERKE